MAAAAGEDRPLGILALERWPADAALPPMLPSYPLIGIGDPTHPLAPSLDVVVEPPISADAVVRGILRSPRAAEAAVQLLRAGAAMPPRDALVAESLCLAMLQGSAEHIAWLDARVPQLLSSSGMVEIDRTGDVLCVTIDRPGARNAIDRVIRDGLHGAFSLAVHDPAIVRIDLRARGRAFGIGADLAEFGTTRDPATAHLIRMATLPAIPLVARPGLLDVAVQGACIGASLEIAAFGGRLVATRSAWFQLPELAMGIVPGAGGSVSIPRRIGRQRTALMLLSGRRIDTATALRWGLVDALVDDPPGDDGGAHPD